MTIAEKTTSTDKTLGTDEMRSRLVAAGAQNSVVRLANPSHYWAHRQEGDAEAHYYWEDVPVSRGEYMMAKGEDL